MLFYWDPSNTGHIARHAVTSEEAEQVIANDPLDLERQLRNGERRFLHLGETDAGRILYVVVADHLEGVRVVTAFPANKKARKFYSTQKAQRHGKHDSDGTVHERE